MDLEHRVANLRDPAFEALGCAITVLVAPRPHALLGLFCIARSVRRKRVLDHAEEPVLGAEHVLDHVAQRPLTHFWHSVEILVAQSGERAGEIAVGVVVLAEDALRLRRRRGPHRGQPHRKVAQLVLRHEEREPESLLVVLAPHPWPVHLGGSQVDGRVYQRLDSFGDRRHYSATTGTPATVSEATLSTTACRCPVSFHTRIWRSALVPSRTIVWR